jgi:hypothetical protein
VIEPPLFLWKGSVLIIRLRPSDHIRCGFSKRLEPPLASGFSLASSHLRTVLQVFVRAHISQNHIPRLRPRITLPKALVIVPHQLTIRLRHNRSLRARVHRRSAVKVEPRVGKRLGDVGFVRNEELNQHRRLSPWTEKLRMI